MLAYGHVEEAYVEGPLAPPPPPPPPQASESEEKGEKKKKGDGKGKGKGKEPKKADAKSTAVESSFLCELRCMQQPAAFKEISRWLVQAPRDYQPGPFVAPTFIFAPTKLIDVHTPFVIVRARVAVTSYTYGELCDYQNANLRPVPDRFVPPLVLKSKRYYPKGGQPATSYVDGPSMAVKSMRTKSKKVAMGAHAMPKGKRKTAKFAGRPFDLPLYDFYGSLGIATTARTAGIRSRPTAFAPRWWIKEILGIYARPMPIPVGRLPSFCREWHPAIAKATAEIVASLNLAAADVLPNDILVRFDRLRINTTDRKKYKTTAALRDIENFLRLPMSGPAVANLCAYYPRKALAGLSEAKISALLNAFAAHAERVLFSAPIYFDMPSDVVFREFEKQALGMVPAFRLDAKVSTTADQLELYRRFLCAAWYRGDVTAMLPETLETDEERQARHAKEDVNREKARKKKAQQRRREEGIHSDEEDFHLMLDDSDDDDDDEGESVDDYNDGPRKKKTQQKKKKKRRDKFAVALENAAELLVEQGRIIRLPAEHCHDVAISEFLAEEMQLATYLRAMPASVRVVENRRNMAGYVRYLAHSAEGEILNEGIVFAFAPTEVEAEHFDKISKITTRCHAQLTARPEDEDGSVDVDTLIIVAAEQFGNAPLLRLLRRFTIKRHLILIGNPAAWRDPRYLGAGQPFRELYDTAYNYKPEVLSICTIDENELGEVAVEVQSGSPSLLNEACKLREWSEDREAKLLTVTADRAKKALARLAQDANQWPSVQVFQSGAVRYDSVRELCPSPCPAFDAQSGMIRVGQRLYLRDTGERVVVAACGVGSTAATMSYWDTMPSSCLESVSARRLNAIVEATLPLAREHIKREYCGCTTSRHLKRFFPHRHHVTDGACINIRQYSGPSVEIAFLLAGKGTCRKDLITLASLASKQCIIVPMDGANCNLYDVVASSQYSGWQPTTMLATLIEGEGEGEGEGKGEGEEEEEATPEVNE